MCPGFLTADPRVVENPREIRSITYKELRELSYMGASVLHEDAMFPVHRAGIPTNIRNTNCPEHPGTIISLDMPEETDTPTITGHRRPQGLQRHLCGKGHDEQRTGLWPQGALRAGRGGGSPLNTCPRALTP